MKVLRTASLDFKFTGSYIKKSVSQQKIRFQLSIHKF